MAATTRPGFKPAALNRKTILGKDGMPANQGGSPFQTKIRDGSKKMQVAFWGYHVPPSDGWENSRGEI
jgi:hypothetical protein